VTGPLEKRDRHTVAAAAFGLVALTEPTGPDIFVRSDWTFLSGPGAVRCLQDRTFLSGRGTNPPSRPECRAVGVGQLGQPATKHAPSGHPERSSSPGKDANPE
jgi:hypothetical protein